VWFSFDFSCVRLAGLLHCGDFSGSSSNLWFIHQQPSHEKRARREKRPFYFTKEVAFGVFVLEEFTRVHTGRVGGGGGGVRPDSARLLRTRTSNCTHVFASMVGVYVLVRELGCAFTTQNLYTHVVPAHIHTTLTYSLTPHVVPPHPHECTHPHTNT
jgi:hypothetical protein